MKAKEPLEKEIQNSILEYLNMIGVYAWMNQSVGVFDVNRKRFRKNHNKHSVNGVSDILGVYDGTMLAIEVKRPSNKTRTEDQDSFIKNVNEKGGKAFYATSIDDVKRELGL